MSFKFACKGLTLSQDFVVQPLCLSRCWMLQKQPKACSVASQVGHVKTGSCTAELWFIGITTEMCRRITGAVRDLP